MIDVFVRGGTGALYQREYNNGWQSWTSLGGVLYPGTGPAACSWGPGRLDVFVEGTDGALWHQGYHGAWDGWGSLGGVLTASPAATSPTSGVIDVFVRGGSGGLWQTVYNNGWSGWTSISAPPTTTFGSIPVNYTRYGNGPILTPPTATNELSELSVIKAKGIISNPIDNYYLYTAPHNEPGGVYLYTAPTPEGPWTLYSQTPIIQNSIFNNNDVSHVSSPWVVWNDDAHKFYCYFHAGFTQTGLQVTYLATSTNGISWTLYSTNPVLSVGDGHAWDSYYVAYAVVARVSSSNWYMWYEGSSDGSDVAIGLATSTDGVRWTKYSGNPVLSADPSIGEPTSPGAMTGSVYYNSDNGGTFYLLYGLGEMGARNTNLASTQDGHTFTRYANNPILAPSASGWDSACAAGGVLFYDSGTYYLFYLGASGNEISNIYVGLASSPPNG